MNEHEKALPAGGPAKPTQNAVKIYVISSRERLLLPLAFCFCLLLVNTLLWSGPTAGLTAPSASGTACWGSIWAAPC